MATGPGHSAKVYAGASATPSDDVGGCESCTDEMGRDLFDVTSLDDGAWRRREQGLKDRSISLSGVDVPGDAGLGAIIDNIDGTADLYVQVLPDGTNGYESQMVCTSFTLSIAAEGRIEYSCDLVCNDSDGWSDVGTP